VEFGHTHDQVDDMMTDWSTWGHDVTATVPLWFLHYYWPPHMSLHLLAIKHRGDWRHLYKLWRIHSKHWGKSLSICTKDQNITQNIMNSRCPIYKPSFVEAVSGVEKIRELSSAKFTARRTRGISVSTKAI